MLLRRRSTLQPNNLNESKTPKAFEGKTMKRASISSNSLMADKASGQLSSMRKFACPSRTRRQALCSTVLMTKNQSSRPQSRSGSHVNSYDLEPVNGFILRTNSKVYRSSSFKNDEFKLPSQRGPRTSSAQGGREVPRIFQKSPGGGRVVQRTFRRPPGCGRDAYNFSHGVRQVPASPVGTRKARRLQNLSPGGLVEECQQSDTLSPERDRWASNSSFESGSYESLAVDSLSHGEGGMDNPSLNSTRQSRDEDDFNSSSDGSTGEPQRCNSSPDGEVDNKKYESDSEGTVFQENAEVPQTSGAGGSRPHPDPLSETQNDLVPKAANIKHNVPPSVLRARRQQLERAKKIREVTNAVEIIQSAYRRYLNRKKC